MLQIKNISKRYQTGELIQTALNNVSLNFRDNEFVSILGPSGSGKTTLLNVIGGLDHYDSGDLIINNISTRQYKSRDWDSYRNHTIGFVFQSYNLIPHQSILSNVELALTISGISRKERKSRAIKALTDVGLGEQIHKKPTQMSGGQMQRVAIARALVNDPHILLADEPTGALDTETSIQVMELLKNVAKDRLVIMVTHNPELAQSYSTRIVKLKDGQIIDDTNPYSVNNSQEVATHKNMGKSSMSFMTSLSLSFNNLRTKKGRTFLTAFAGSIGIIGIALILSLSTGVNSYIESVQKETMTSYPITIEEKTVDLTNMMGSGGRPMGKGNGSIIHDMNAVYSNPTDLENASKIQTSITQNNLTDFKKYLDNKDNNIHKYIGETGIIYSYDVNFDTFSYDTNGILVNTDGSTLTDNSNNTTSTTPPMMGGDMSPMAQMNGSSTNTFEQLIPASKGEKISAVVYDNYDLIYGQWPSTYDEVILVLDENNEVSLSALYALGLLPSEEYQEIMDKINNGEEYKAESHSFNYNDLCNKTFSLVPTCDYYVKNSDGLFENIKDDEQKLDELVKNALQLKIVGIIRPTQDASNASINGAIAYLKDLTDYVIEYSNNSEIVKAQLDSKDKNVLNGMKFSPDDDSSKIADVKKYISEMGVSDKASTWTKIATSLYSGNMQQLQGIMSMDETQKAKMLDDNLESLSDEILLSTYNSLIDSGNYDDNLSAFGYVNFDVPSSISIYSDSFENKESISTCIDEYNKTVSEENKITYTDFVAILMSSVTTIINIITYVLIAFVAVSLVVSSLMIGIITYISVLERKKEIGILRAIGASKRNVSQVFNAETFIIGLIAGLIGIGISELLLLPTNAIIHLLTGNSGVNAFLPLTSALILIVLSVLLTLLGGLIPAKKAAKKDPVEALRSE